MAWLSGYSYRKKVVITGESGAGANYQVPLSIGSSIAGDLHLEGHCQTFPNDIRFTTDDEVTQLSYWIEDVGADPITVWVKVTDDLGVNRDIYVYYGKTGDSGNSDGINTFELFDDFNDESLDLNKWIKETENGAITESDGYLRVGGGSTSPPSYGWSSLGSSPSYADFLHNAVKFRARVATGGIGEVAVRGIYASDYGYKARFDQRTPQGNGLLKPPYTPGVWNFYVEADGLMPTVDTYYTYEYALDGTAHKFYRDGVLVRSGVDGDYQSNGEVSLQNHYGSYTDFDWVLVRKYQATEPAFSSVGIEETAPFAYYHGLKVQRVGELALCDVGTHPLRIRKGGTTYGIELVATDDPNASAVRIKTGAGIKAIRKYT